MSGVSGCRPRSRMAAVVQLSFLLFTLISNLHAEERIIIRKEGHSYTFGLPQNTNSCLISRFVGEEKLVLWNTSDLWSQNSTVPEDLKRRLVSRATVSSYTILNLTHSDSGPYREECWTEGNMKYEKIFNITVCSSVDETEHISQRLGETVELPCGGAADNLDIQWLKISDVRYEQETWTREFGHKTTLHNVTRRYQLVTNTSALRIFHPAVTDFAKYNCLVMNLQQCVSSTSLDLCLEVDIIYRSVEETAVLPCTVADLNDDQPPYWKKRNPKTQVTETDLGRQNHTVLSVDQNYSLVFSSLTLNHTGGYVCNASMREKTYWLVVCPKFGPPAVKLFSEGEEISLTCRHLEEGHLWFIKSNRTEGRIFSVTPDVTMSRVSRFQENGSLLISNASLEDTGEYWCAVIDPYYRCVSTSKTLVKYREPLGFPSTFYIVRCSVLSVLLLMLCVVVVAVNQRTRRAEQLSAHRDT